MRGPVARLVVGLPVRGRLRWAAGGEVAWSWRVAAAVGSAAQAFGVSLSQAERAAAVVLAAEFLACRRVVAGCGAITHHGHFGCGEQL